MSDSVIIPVELGGSGRKYTNDNDLLTGMGLGGHRARFVALCNEMVGAAAVVVNASSNVASRASQVALNLTNDNLANFVSTSNTAFNNINTAITALGTTKASLSGAAFTGAASFAAAVSFAVSPTAPTAAAGDSSTKVATTAFVRANSKKPGEAFIHTGSTPPAGALAVPSTPTNLSRATYAAYHAEMAAAGYPYGNGDGSTTFGMIYLPPGYALVQSAGGGTIGQTTVGEVISHDHGTNAGSNGSSGNTGSGIPLFAPATRTTNTGGAANKAAGVFVLFCVQYQG